MTTSNERGRRALSRINACPKKIMQKSSQQDNVCTSTITPRRSTRRAAKEANEKLNSNQLRRLKYTRRSGKIAIHSLTLDDQEGTETAQVLPPSIGASALAKTHNNQSKSPNTLVKAASGFESFIAKKKSSSQARGAENVDSTSQAAKKMNSDENDELLLSPGPETHVTTRNNHYDHRTNIMNSPTEASVKITSSDDSKVCLLLLTIVAGVFGVLFSLIFGIVYHVASLVTKATAAVPVLRTRFGMVSFFLKLTLLWLKDVPVENKYARFFIMVARWMFVVYLFLPLFVHVIVILLHNHIVFSITGIVLLVML